MVTSGPFIFIATNRVKRGRFDAERRRVPELSAFIAANEPRILAFNEYATEDATEVRVVQVHPDAESMALQMEVVVEQAARAYAETLDATTGIQVFGARTDAILATLRRSAGAGVRIDVAPHHLGGFTRLRG